MGIAGSPASPLKGLLSTVDTQTALVKPDSATAGKLLDAAAIACNCQLLAKTLGGGEDGGGAHNPGARIAAHFAPIHELLAGTAGHAPIDQLLAALTRTHDQLQSIGSGWARPVPSMR